MAHNHTLPLQTANDAPTDVNEGVNVVLDVNEMAAATTVASETFDFDECPICFDEFNNKKKLKITCGCTYSVCLECAKECLMQIEKEPHCIHCKRAWNRDFLYSNIGSTFINGKYKKYRKQLLFELEKTRLPLTMEKIPNINKIKKLENQSQTIREQIKNLREQMKALQQHDYNIRIEIWHIRNDQINGNGDEDAASATKERKRFIRPCPAEGCRGFLSTAYKCELCETKVCAKCFEIKSSDADVEHVCDENNVKNADAIRKETKPCPQCGIPIFKISGCDQMWCTQCNIAFSWKSGRVETGVIHNPHYYDFMRKQGTAIQNPGAHLCGGVMDHIQRARILNLLDRIVYRNPENQIKFLTNSEFVLPLNIIPLMGVRYLLPSSIISHYTRMYNHIFQTIIDPIRIFLRNNNPNEDLRMRYLQNEIDEARFKTLLMTRDNQIEKKRAMLQVLELFINVLLDNIRNFYMTIENDSKFKKMSQSKQQIIIYKETGKMITNILQVRQYCNGELLKIARNYKMKVYYIPFDIDIQNGLYSSEMMESEEEIDRTLEIIMAFRNETIIVYDGSN